MHGRVLLTGATGFLGQAMAAELRARGVAVRALVRPRSRANDAPLRALRAQGVEIVWGNLLNRREVALALRGAEQVFHMAGQLQVAGIPDQVYAQLHIDGTRSLLDACAASSAVQRIVHCSTTGVLGPTGPRPRNEDAPLQPVTIYERTKAAGEALALKRAQRDGLPVTVARPALVYGPGDLHLLGWFRAISRGLYRVVGAGDTLLHPIYISDLVEGMLRCTSAPVGRVYHLVGEHALAIGALAAAIASALGRTLPRWHIPLPAAHAAAALLECVPGLPPDRLPLTRSRITFMTESRAYCGCRARAELGFAPQVALAAGLQHTVAWYRQEGLL